VGRDGLLSYCVERRNFLSRGGNGLRSDGTRVGDRQLGETTQRRKRWIIEGPGVLKDATIVSGNMHYTAFGVFPHFFIRKVQNICSKICFCGNMHLIRRVVCHRAPYMLWQLRLSRGYRILRNQVTIA